ncbi:MAG: DUF294 nucleotidyltransferase-like domain-containing protein [Desulfuromonadales bacterium]
MDVNSDSRGFISELKRHCPFDRMDEVHISWLAEQLEPVEMPCGTVVLNPGVPCDALYFISRGVIRLEAMGNSNSTDDQKVLAELVQGEVFPLEALEEHRPVFSTFRAGEDTFCFRLTADNFDILKQKSTIFSDFCRYRAASFLEQSRRVYRLHFSHQSVEQQRLNTPLSLLMKPHPLTVETGKPVREVVAAMYERDLDYIVVIDCELQPRGIFTVRDLLRKVVVPCGDLNMSVEDVMSSSLQTLPISALGYEAALLMAEQGFHHVVLVDNGKLAGVVTERELFNLQRVSLSQINAEIQTARDLDKLRSIAGDIRILCENMVIEGVTSDQLTQIISTLNDHLVSRVLELILTGSDLKGIRVAWTVFGSEGRMEQTFSTDQDNGIIFETPEDMDADAAREILLPVARRFNQILDGLGFTLCKGNIMAGNPDCCLSFEEWQRRFADWIQTPTPEALLNANVFFDFRHLYGDATISDRLRLWLVEAVKMQPRFFLLMMENALERTPPIGFFRDFVVDDHKEHPNTIDIKQNGVTLFVDAARVYALACGVTRGNTRQRLLAVGDLKKWPQSEVNAWAEAFLFLQSLRIRNQLESRRNGGLMHNRLNPYELNNLDRKFFLESLRQAGALQKRLSSDFSQRMM